jgi:hypothetical protein
MCRKKERKLIKNKARSKSIITTRSDKPNKI